MRRDYGISINWEEVHAISHGLHDNPHHILGPHLEWDGVVINAYVKDALKVDVLHRDSDVEYEMRASGIADFFTLATDEKTAFPYSLRATYRDGSTYEYVDAYCFEPVVGNDELAAFSQGISYEAYKLLGAHKRTVDGVEGVLFVVWAPNAQRVSVVGEFNLWEGSRGLMRRLSDSGVFELFIPGLEIGTTYKYEIRTRDGRIFTKADPYATKNDVAPGNVSIVADADYKFKDGKWIKSRDAKALTKKAFNVLEVNLGEYAALSEDATYRTLAPVVYNAVKDMGYTHIELLPVMDCANDASLGFETRGFFAVSSKLGDAADLKYFVDYMHQHDLGVIFDWAPHHFGKDEAGLYLFDGAPAYEDANPLRADYPAWGTVAFNYGRKEVSNFLISNALYWVEEFHADGLRVASVASMLYLDYGRNEGEWLPNIYGSNENLDAIEFFKHLNSIMKKRNPGVLMIAEDTSLWADVTKDVEEDGLGFDYKWNLGWSADMLEYIGTDISSRRGIHHALTFSLLYAYNENFMYGFNHRDSEEGLALRDKIAGNSIQQFGSKKALFGFMMMMPGKKYNYFGVNEIILGKDATEEEKQMLAYVKGLSKLYAAEPALYEDDYKYEGFEWINNLSAKDGLVTFTRKTSNPDDTLVVVCNFSPEEREDYPIGVPYEGKYKEIFTSDLAEFGGEGIVNARMRQSKKEEVDARENSMVTNVPAFGLTVYKYNVAGGASKTASKKEEEKKVPAKKTETKVEKKAEAKAEPAKKAAAKVEKKAEAKAEPAKKAEAKVEKKAEVKAEPAKKAEPKVEKKVEAKKEEPKKETAKKVTAKKETKKAAPKKTAAKKATTAKKTEAKAEPKKTEVKAEPKKEEPKVIKTFGAVTRIGFAPREEEPKKDKKKKK